MANWACIGRPKRRAIFLGLFKLWSGQRIVHNRHYTLGFLTKYTLMLLAIFWKNNKSFYAYLYLPCTGIFTHSMGLLCSHNLLVLCQNKSYIRLENIHPRWFFCCTSWPTAYLQPSIILDPLLVARRRGRPRAAGYRQVLGNNQSWEREEENKENRKIGVERRNLQPVSRRRDWRQDRR